MSRRFDAPLLWSYVALIAYASLYPITSWRAPTVPAAEWLLLPWPRRWEPFDVAANLLGYLPLGLLLYGAWLRTGLRLLGALALAAISGALLSLAMEELQSFLPPRVPSRLDWALNSAGALLGALLGVGLHGFGAVRRWQAVRDRWFIGGSALALALLLLWPVGLLFPPPLPFGLGHVVARLPEFATQWLADTPLAGWLGEWPTAEKLRPLSAGAEALVIMLGLLAPCLLAFTVAKPGWRRWVLALGIAAAGFAVTTLSTALNFGPEHAFSWRTPAVAPAFAAGLVFAALAALLPQRAAAGLGLVVLTALAALVARAPADPYYAQSLHEWAQGRFIRFHGVAQWVGWIWPYATLVYLLVRVAERPDE